MTDAPTIGAAVVVVALWATAAYAAVTVALDELRWHRQRHHGRN